MCGVAALCASTVLGAQQALLPLDDIAYTYIDALQARGQFRDLPIIGRPYSVGLVRSAVQHARTTSRDPGTVRWLDAIDAAAEKYAPGVTARDSGVFTASAAAYGVAQSNGNRDLLKSDDRSAVAPGFTLRALLQSGPVTVAGRLLADRRMRDDPEFLGRRDRVLSSRTEEAYVGVSSRFATLQVGRVSRSWALPGQLGLMLSDGAYSYDHAYLRVGTNRVHLASVIARLDDEPRSFATDTVAQRFFTTHRLGVAIGEVEAGISESVIYGGVGRGFTPALASPASALFLTQYSDAELINVAFGADAIWRRPGGLTLGGQLFVDDFQIDRCSLCGEPPGIGLTLTADGVSLPHGLRGFASYVRVNTLTYRAPDRFERYTSRWVGLGQRSTDFDEVRGGVDLGPQLSAPVRVYVAYRRQGEGSYLAPYPPVAQRATWPAIFEGTVMRTVRLAASGALRLGRDVEISGDAGLNRATNDGHIAGRVATRFEGRLRVALEPSWGRLRAVLF